MADSCSNWKRWRIEVLASITMPTRSGRLICWWKDVHPGRSSAVVEQRKVALPQVGNILPVPVGDREDEVDLIDGQHDRGRAIVHLLIGLGLRGWLLGRSL